ncbi:MAG: DMT family transporter [Pseudomonadota bacterium]|jgi:drug/metabolite transporter (DMT)-like permease|nr:DMT family transporter [Syntrophaceae bacterium]MBP7032795.1 DMT family transporter [Syntrophobacterales bacterium]MDI9554725.1 DMT family transporter [Pseudomonadota bacterium]NLX30688.1 DMT family transporter [Deltaproteobacteria bacterium]HNU84605.1 DMT family transporter [Syntrophales bacterium]
MERQTRAYLYAVATVGLWSTVASAFKLTLDHMGFLEMLLGASVVSLAALFVIVLAQGKLAAIAHSSAKDLACSAALGFLNPFLYYVILFKAYSVLPAQEAQPLNWTWPIMLVLLSIAILKQPIRWASVLAVAISFSGVLVISTRGDVLAFRFTNLPGALLALGSSIVWALFWIYNVKDYRDEIVKLFLNFVFGSIFTLAAVLFFGELRVPPSAGLLGVLWIGLFEMGITFVSWLKALQLSRTTAQVSNLVYAAPFLSLFLIHFIVGEEILPSTVLGLVLIVAGVIVQQYANRSKKA